MKPYIPYNQYVRWPWLAASVPGNRVDSKAPAKRLPSGRPAKCTVDQFFNLLPMAGGMPRQDWIRAAHVRYGIAGSDSSAKRYIRALLAACRINRYYLPGNRTYFERAGGAA